MTASRQRAVLAALLLSAGRTVGLDELAEVLWGTAPPQTARVSTQNYVMRLRFALGEAGRARIRTLPGGYSMSVGAGELDVSRFEALAASADGAARSQSWMVSAARAEEALALWRGEPLTDAGSDLLVMRHGPRLAELRLAVIETRAEARMHLGYAASVTAELRQLAVEHPLRERVHGLLMTSLHQQGRQAEALAAYQQARQVLVEELGTEPGVALQDLHRQILAGTPAPEATLVPVPGAGEARGEPEEAPPLQLPASVRHFTGRAGELAALTRLLDQAGQGAPGTVLISAIGGTAGVGKTALAVYWAHQVAERFPDGQLYVNLRGYDASHPVVPGDALAGFLRTLGVAGTDIPADTDERAARYRSLLARRRMLVLLDNADSEEQVRPLLPASSASVVVVTSRDRLPGLVARDGATRLDLDLLPPADARDLLTALIGKRASADQASVTSLANLCARLPLALRVAAELAAARPEATLTSLVDDLADQPQRLAQLDAGGDPSTAVRSVFSWSCRHLGAAPIRAFRLTSLHPCADFDAYSVAALAGGSLDEARLLLGRLARAYLIQPGRGGRYGMHDLLRAYAWELSDTHDRTDDRNAALTRLFDYYLYMAAAAMDALRPWDRHLRPTIARPASPVAPVADAAAAQTWLDAQLACLVAVTGYTAEREWPAHAIQLAAVLLRYLERGGHHAEALIIHTCARAAARRTGDHAAEAAALTALGLVAWRQDHYQRASALLRRALALSRQAGDRRGEALALMVVGLVDFAEGRYQQADGRHRRALALFRQAGDKQGEARTLSNLAVAEYELGRYQQAAGHLRKALNLCRDTADQVSLAGVLGRLGSLELRLGRYDQAARHLEDALAICRDTGNRIGVADARSSLGDLYLRQGRHEQAASSYQDALVLYREFGDRANEAAALNGLGEVLLATGQPLQARAQLSIALGLRSRIADMYDQARTHKNLGQACLAVGDRAQARHHWQAALNLYSRLGTPEAGQVQASLSDLTADSAT